MTTKVLIVYETVPESTSMYLVEADDAALADLKLAHGHLINNVDGGEISDALDRISLRLGNSPASEEFLEEVNADASIVGVWSGNKIKDSPVDTEALGVQLVVTTGFLM